MWCAVLKMFSNTVGADKTPLKSIKLILLVTLRITAIITVICNMSLSRPFYFPTIFSALLKITDDIRRAIQKLVTTLFYFQGFGLRFYPLLVFKLSQHGF